VLFYFCRQLRPKCREKRAAHSLMPPLRLMNGSSGSESGLYAAAYRMTRDHLLLVRLSALARSAMHRMMAANGSSRSEISSLRKQTARRARLISWPSAAHHATKSYTAVR